MEEDEEIQSQRSEENSRSPSPPSNGRITVTVASSRQSLSPPPQKHQPASKNSGGGGSGREDCWSEGATEILIEAWGERYLELSRGNLKQKHWKEVAEVVSTRDDYSKTPKTDIQCKNRIDTVKKKYKAEKAKRSAGGAPSKWIFFDRLDQLIGPTAKNTKVPISIPVGFRSAMSQFRANSDPESRQKQQKRTAVIKKKNQKIQPRNRNRKRAVAETESEEEDEDEVSEESMESLPPPPPEKKAKKVEKLGNSVKELTQAMLKFGEAYEQAESAKLQQLVEMEKQRMKFAKELELQRMQFFMKTQMEISQLKNSRKGGNGNGNTSNHNHSDCSN